MLMDHPGGRRACLAAAGCCLLAAVALRAGAQSREDRDGQAPIEAPDGVVAAIGGPGSDMPWIVAPAVRGRGGVHARLTLHDARPWRVRVGLGHSRPRVDGNRPPALGAPTSPWTLEGSEIAWRHDAGEWYASVQRRHWGPGWTGSLILDAAAQPLAAIGWRRPQARPSAHPLLQWMGPWSADVFFGRLTGHEQPTRPALIGMRLQINPVPPLQLGFSRALQWGGHGRPEGMSALTHALLGRENVGTDGIDASNDPGNQLAGFDWRWRFGPQARRAFYGQLIGEDENGYMPSAYIVQVGLESRWRQRDAEWHVFAEWNDLIAGHAAGGNRPPGITYRHHLYQQGYSHACMPLGHPAGGDVTLAGIGLAWHHPGVRALAVLSRGRALATAQRFAAGRIRGLDARLTIDLDERQQLGLSLWWWRDSAERLRAWQWMWSIRT